MDRFSIYESALKAVKESLEWGIGSDKYGYFVDGVFAMMDNALEKQNEHIARLKESIYGHYDDDDDIK